VCVCVFERERVLNGMDCKLTCLRRYIKESKEVLESGTQPCLCL
jgi:hypothetical protein